MFPVLAHVVPRKGRSYARRRLLVRLRFVNAREIRAHQSHRVWQVEDKASLVSRSMTKLPEPEVQVPGQLLSFGVSALLLS